MNKTHGKSAYAPDACSSCGRKHFNPTAVLCWFCSTPRANTVQGSRPIAARTMSVSEMRRDTRSKALARASSFDFLGGMIAGVAIVILPLLAVIGVQI